MRRSYYTRIRTKYDYRGVTMKTGAAMLSSITDQWATPQSFFDELNKEFKFTLDPCADENNHKCDKYFTKEQNGLKQDWGGEVVFCNPPYGNK